MLKINHKLHKIKGDASFREFYRKKIKSKSSIIIFSKKEKRKNLLIYDAINKILIMNKFIAPKYSSVEHTIFSYDNQCYIFKPKHMKCGNKNKQIKFA